MDISSGKKNNLNVNSFERQLWEKPNEHRSEHGRMKHSDERSDERSDGRPPASSTPAAPSPQGFGYLNLWWRASPSVLAHIK